MEVHNQPNAMNMTAALDTLLSHTQDAVFVVEKKGEGWFISVANHMLVKLLRQPLEGRFLSRILSPEQFKKLNEKFHTVLETEQLLSFKVDTKFHLEDDERIMNIRLVPLYTGDKITSIMGIMHEKTESLRQGAENKNLKERFSSVFEHAPNGVCFVDSSHQVFMVNPSFAKVTSKPVHYLRSHKIEDILHVEDRPVFLKAMDKVFSGNRSYDGMDLRVISDGDEEKWISLSMSLAQEHVTAKAYLILQAVDISHRKKEEQRLIKLATKDHLTGLYNRMVFEDALKRYIKQAQRYNQSGAILYIDLDDFKIVNDTLGHEAGDEVLKEVSRLLELSVRDSDMAARLGGDEFAIILQYVSEQEAHVKATQIRDLIKNMSLEYNGSQIRVGASIGVEPFGVGETLEANILLKRADQAMYDKKAVQKEERNQLLSGFNS